MTRRGTTLNWATTGGIQRRKTLYAADLINTTGVLHDGSGGATTLQAGWGKSSTGVYGLALATIGDSDTIDFPFLDIYDVDLAEIIYFDLLWAGLLAGGDEAMSIGGTYLQCAISTATANLSDFATVGAAMSPAAVTYTYVATDIGNLRKMSGLYIPASSITSNEDALAIRITFDQTNCAADDFVVIGGRLKYTARAGY